MTRHNMPLPGVPGERFFMRGVCRGGGHGAERLCRAVGRLSAAPDSGLNRADLTGRGISPVARGRAARTLRQSAGLTMSDCPSDAMSGVIRPEAPEFPVWLYAT